MTLSTEEKQQLLREVAIFDGVDGSVLVTIAEQARELEFPAGHFFARDGDMGTGFFVILKGRVRVIRHGVEVASLGPRDFVGEMSIVERVPRIANVVAAEPVVCLGFASWELDQFMQQQPHIAEALREAVERRHRELERNGQEVS